MTSVVPARASGRRLPWQGGRPVRQRRYRTRPARAGTLLVRLVAIALALCLWQLLVLTGVLTTYAVAEPTATARALGSLISTSPFWSAIGHTLHSWAIGLGISLLIAVPAGLVLGSSDLLYRLFRVTIDFLRTIPPVAVLPLALLLYGAREKMVLLLVVFGSVWPLLLQSMYGVHQVDPVARDVARSYRFRRRDLVFSVVVPSAAPFIATGIRLAATISLLLVVGAELLGSTPGLGRSIALAEQNQHIPTMYAFVVATAGLGVLLNLALRRLEGVVLTWHSSQRARALA